MPIPLQQSCANGLVIFNTWARDFRCVPNRSPEANCRDGGAQWRGRDSFHGWCNRPLPPEITYECELGKPMYSDHYGVRRPCYSGAENLPRECRDGSDTYTTYSGQTRYCSDY